MSGKIEHPLGTMDDVQDEEEYVEELGHGTVQAHNGVQELAISPSVDNDEAKKLVDVFGVLYQELLEDTPQTTLDRLRAVVELGTKLREVISEMTAILDERNELQYRVKDVEGQAVQRMSTVKNLTAKASVLEILVEED